MERERENRVCVAVAGRERVREEVRPGGGGRRRRRGGRAGGQGMGSERRETRARQACSGQHQLPLTQSARAADTAECVREGRSPRRADPPRPRVRARCPFRPVNHWAPRLPPPPPLSLSHPLTCTVTRSELYPSSPTRSTRKDSADMSERERGWRGKKGAGLARARNRTKKKKVSKEGEKKSRPRSFSRASGAPLPPCSPGRGTRARGAPRAPRERTPALPLYLPPPLKCASFLVPRPPNAASAARPASATRRSAGPACPAGRRLGMSWTACCLVARPHPLLDGRRPR